MRAEDPRPPGSPRVRIRPFGALLGAVAAVLLLTVAVGLGTSLRERRAGIPSTAGGPRPAASPPAAGGVATPGPTAGATPAAQAEVGAYLRPQASAWRPRIASLIVSERRWTGTGPNETTYVAVPADGSAATKLITVRDGDAAAMTLDGRALAVTVKLATQPPTSRLAVWEPVSGAVRWVTPAEPGVTVSNPAWSADGMQVYFGRSRVSSGGTPTEDLGIFRVRADGTDERRIIAGRPVNDSPRGISIPQHLTQGVLLWGRSFEGSSLEVLELATGRQSSYGPGRFQSWRPTQPRSIVEHCSNGDCAGLVLWNDVTGAKRALLRDDVRVDGADWDPNGTRIVVAQRSAAGWALHVVAEATGASSRIAGSDNAQRPLWLAAGITYEWGTETSGTGAITPRTEIRIIAATGGAARTLYRSPASEITLQRIGYVLPPG